MSIGTIAIAFTDPRRIPAGHGQRAATSSSSWLEVGRDVGLPARHRERARIASRSSTFLRAQPTVAARRLRVAERALERFRADFPELRDVTAGIGENPFPSAFEVRLRTGNGGEADADEPVAGGCRAARRRRRAVRSPVAGAAGRHCHDRAAGAALVAGILMLGAAFTVAAVVRLSLYARRDELEIMQLVGAPFTFIRGPFVVEGLLLGGIGARRSTWRRSPSCIRRCPGGWDPIWPGFAGHRAAAIPWLLPNLS